MRLAVFTISMLFSLVSCAQTSIDGFPLPASARQDGVTFSVRHQPRDERRLDLVVAESLRKRGIDVLDEGEEEKRRIDTAVAEALIERGIEAPGGDEEAQPDYIVSYVDRWYWDMRHYLIDFRVDVRDSQTNVLVGTARSYQTSLAAMGRTHRSVIEETIDVLISGMEARLAEKERREQTRRRRR